MGYGCLSSVQTKSLLNTAKLEKKDISNCEKVGNVVLNIKIEAKSLKSKELRYLQPVRTK